MQQREREFLEKVTSQLHHMDTYEDPAARAAALAVIPVDRLEEQARAQLEAARSSGEEVGEEDFRDLLLLQLKEWFKTDFFKWQDAPPCPGCGGKTEGGGPVEPTTEERAGGAGRVEGWRCVAPACGQPARYPRYHSRPARLLETRRGRCGEWANCFVLCCRALGFDTRLVLDWTDHVWAEVWSHKEDRWLHVDPGEAVDSCLIYEVGWGKKLTYVIAHSKDEVQDVTWRYSKDHAATRARRHLVRPSWLTATLLRLSADRQAGRSQEERDRLRNRRVGECLSLLTPREAGEGDSAGRRTGSVAWRTARGELGGERAAGHVFRPTGGERERGVMRVEYCVARDQYTRAGELGWVSDPARGGGLGFLRGAHEVTNVARKVEADWNMVYLARREGSSEKGSITWKLSLEETEGLEVGRVEVTVASAAFHGARVVWQVCGGPACLLPQPGVPLVTDQLAGSREVSVTASLSGGEGPEAWQHAQLFRSPRSGGTEEPQLRIQLWLKKA